MQLLALHAECITDFGAGQGGRWLYWAVEVAAVEVATALSLAGASTITVRVEVLVRSEGSVATY